MAPIVEANENQLEAQAATHYRALKEREKAGELSPQLTEVFVDLMWQRFKDLTAKELKKMLQFEEVDLKDSVAGKEIWQESRADVAIKLATKRFGKLKAAQTKKINALSNADLDRLVLDLLDFESAADLDAWLKQAPGS